MALKPAVDGTCEGGDACLAVAKKQKVLGAFTQGS